MQGISMQMDSSVGGYMPQYIIDKYNQKNAYWEHDGNPLRPHVELTGGLHSGAFFNSDPIMHDFFFLNVVAQKFTAILASMGYSTKEIQRIIGPAMGAILFAHHLGGVVSHENGIYCPSGFAEKSFDENGNKIMIFNRCKVNPFEKNQICEDVITTGGTVERTIDAIEKLESMVSEFILTLVNRSGLKEIRGRKIIALFDKHLPNYKPEDCVYCKMGSVALRAKEGNNWQLLHQHYPTN